MARSSVFDVDAFLDSQRIGWRHVWIIGLIILAMMIDGYDILMVGWTLPLIAKDLKVPPQALTSVFVAQQAALFIGTLVVGQISDRFGRRPVLLICIAGFTVLTLVTAFAHTPTQITALRFLSALFCSAVIPLACALASEIAPSRLRAAVVTIVFCGYTGGHFIGSAVQAFVIEDYGWQGAFWVGGLLGLVILVVLAVLLPESIRFRALRNPFDRRVGDALMRLDPKLTLDGDERFVLAERQQAVQHGAVAGLFKDGLAIPTILLWAGFLCAFLVLHISGSWSTTVLHNLGGLSFKYLASLGAVGTAAGIFGMLTAGMLMDRFGAARVMPLFFLGNALSIAGYGLAPLHSPAIYVVAAMAGYFGNSGLGALSALATVLYPSRIRATGLSWGAGAGRVGGMIGPMFGGFMLAEHWGLRTIFLVTGAPLVISAISLMLMGRASARAKANAPEAPPLVAMQEPVP